MTTARMTAALGAPQSPIAELLATFAAPSPAETYVVRERISQISTDLSQLDNEIGRVEDILQGLRRKREALQRIYHGHENILNPTRRLPAEILREIFVQCQAMADGMSVRTASVCRHWRAVAIATPSLWSYLELFFSRKKLVRDAEMIPKWLQRSGGHRLKIWILYKGHKPHSLSEHEIESKKAIFTLLKSQGHRWYDVHLNAHESMPSLLRKIPKNLPILEILNMFCFIPRADFPIHINGSIEAPALHTLTLSSGVASWLPGIPWAQLTTCDMEGTWKKCYHTLQSAVNLKSYTIRSSNIHIEPEEPLSPIHHSNLQSLAIDARSFNQESLRDFFDLLTSPSLTELSLTGIGRRAPSYLAPFITRSSCSLTGLELGQPGAEYAHSVLSHLFSLTPALTDLTLHCEVDAKLMNLLNHYPIHPTGSRRLLPLLTNLKIPVRDRFTCGECADFLSSRHRQLRVVGLFVRSNLRRDPRRLTDKAWQRLKHLRDSGMDIHVESHWDTIYSIEEFLEATRTEGADKGGNMCINHEQEDGSTDEDTQDYATDDESEDEE
ncbi:hypothetical protein HWV62_18612 [Athelia sp. TMB]|nr:hypothetical protein HWV62_18612 [Athelia sp. TMB]